MYLRWMLPWRWNWWIVVTVRFTRARFVIMVVIISAGWLGLHAGESATSIATRADRALHVMNVGKDGVA